MAKSKLRSTSRKGVSKDAKSGSVVPFKVSADNKFNIAYLKSVEVGTRKREDEGKTVPVITFHFINGPKEERQHYHTIWYIDGPWETKSKTYTVEDQNAQQDDFFAHIWDCYMGVGSCASVDLGGGITDAYADAAFEGVEGIEDDGSVESDYFLFYHKVAKQFMEGNSGKPIMIGEDGKPIPAWLKLTYYKGKLGIPLFGNFLDRYRKGVETLLVMGPRDKFEPAPAPSVMSAPSVSNDDIAEDDIPDGF